MSERKLLFVQTAHELTDESKQRITDHLNELSSEYQFVVFGPSMSLMTPEAHGYSFTETLDGYSYTATAPSAEALIDLMDKIKRLRHGSDTVGECKYPDGTIVKADPQAKRGREFI